MPRWVCAALCAMAIAGVDAASIGAPAAGKSVPTDEATIVHVLNRIAFGARPGDVDRVRAAGIARYIDQQLHPERVPDRDIDARLASFTTLRMSSREIADQIEEPQIEARKARKAGDPPTPEDQRANSVLLELSQQKMLRAIYSERQLQEVLADF